MLHNNNKNIIKQRLQTNDKNKLQPNNKNYSNNRKRKNDENVPQNQNEKDKMYVLVVIVGDIAFFKIIVYYSIKLMDVAETFVGFVSQTIAHTVSCCPVSCR